MRVILSFILLFCFRVCALAQDPYFFPLDKLSGLPSNIVYDAYQDTKGFTWFATDNGICRYDGYQIKLYIYNAYPIKSVSNIVEDPEGRIWFQDFDGNLYYIQGEKVQPFTQVKANGFLRFGFVKDRLFVMSKDGLKIVDAKKNLVLDSVALDTKYLKHSVASGEYFYALGKDISRIGTDGTQEKYNTPEDYNKNILVPLPAFYKEDLYIFCKYNSHYYVVRDGVFTLKKLPFSKEFIQNVAVIDELIWICTPQGVYGYNPKTNGYVHYFSDKNISFVRKNGNGKYWFCTLTNGVMYIESLQSILYRTPFKTLRVVGNTNSLYVSTDKDEVYGFDSDCHFRKVYSGNTGHAIRSLYMDSRNNLFFSSSKFIVKTPSKIQRSTIAIKQVIQIDEKYYAFAASNWNGVFYLNPTLKSPLDNLGSHYQRYTEDGVNFVALITSENGKSCVYNPSNGAIYYTTNYGLRKYVDGKLVELGAVNHNITRLALVQGLIYGISNDEKMYSIDSNDNILEIDVEFIIQNQGMVDIKSLNDKLYIFTSQSLFRYDPEEKTSTKIIELAKEADFYDIHELNGYYYLSTSEGIIKFENKPKQIPNKIHLFIDEILINGESEKHYNISNLKYDENNIEVLYSILSETPNDNYKVYYKVNNGIWESMIANNRTLRFSSLAAGNYTIYLKVVSGNDEVVQKIGLYIKKPFWQEWWFYSIGSVLFIVIFFVYYKTTIKRINKKNRRIIERVNLEKDLNHSKLKSLKSQMNPHFFFNALNTLQSYILSNEKREAVEYLSKFSTLTRTILEMTDKDFVFLSEEIQTLELYLEIEKARFNGDFSFTINLSPSLKKDDVRIPSMLLQPYVENAVKHGLLHKTGEKILALTFDVSEQYLVITIEDNGIGRKKSGELNAIKNRKHNSFATASIQKRIELLNGLNENKITIQYIDKLPPNQGNRGTIVILRIPLKY